MNQIETARHASCVSKGNPRRVILFTLLCVSMLAVSPCVAYGQLKFEFGTIKPVLSEYPLSKCWALVKYRLSPQYTDPMASSWETTALRDTAPSHLHPVVNNSIPQELIRAAQPCSDKITVDWVFEAKLSINETKNAFKLLMAVGRTADAMALAERWFAAFPSREDTVRNRMAFDLTMHVVLEAKPFSFELVKTLLSAVDTVMFWEYAMDVMYMSWDRAKLVRDSAAAFESATWLMHASEWLGDSITKSLAWTDPRQGKSRYLRWVVPWLHYDIGLNAVRKSTAAYFDVMDSLYNQAKASNSKTQRCKAIPIVADVWFPQKPAADRPSPGKVSLVYSIDDNELRPSVPLSRWFTLKRFLNRIPDLETTLVASTRGSFVHVAPPSPEVEARLIDSTFRQSFGLPVTVAVHYNKFWRITAPDDRRIDEHGPNENLYPTLPQFPRGKFITIATYLVDRDGYILPIAGRTEDEQVEFIKAVMQQGAQ